MKRKPKTMAGKKDKMGKVMGEFSKGELHSGSKSGPKVTNPRQAKAIAMSEAGMSRKKPKMRNMRGVPI